jgi:hypothetical protein
MPMLAEAGIHTFFNGRKLLRPMIPFGLPEMD